MEHQAKLAIEAHTTGEKSKKRNIFRTILGNPSLPDIEKVYDRISHEGVVAIAAGGETTGRALATATFFILEKRDTVLPRLVEEIKAVMPELDSRPSIRDLERLPLLVSSIQTFQAESQRGAYTMIQTAVIKETLRVNSLVTSRFPLVSPKEPLRYKDWVIPAGVSHPCPATLFWRALSLALNLIIILHTNTSERASFFRQVTNGPGKQTPVSMTLREILNDGDVFEDPRAFNPDRWIDADPDKLERMNKNFIPFGRGSRMCLGVKCVVFPSPTYSTTHPRPQLSFSAGWIIMLTALDSLAWAEMYIVLACVFRRRNFELFETTRSRDIDIVRDCFIGEVEPSSQGIRVKHHEEKKQSS